MKTPKAPDPYDTAQAQMGANIGTAAANMSMNTTNQYGPWGSVEYAQSGTVSIMGPDGKPIEVPRYTQTTTLSPEQQGIYDAGTAAQGNLANLAKQLSGSLGGSLGQPLDTSGLPALQGDFGSNYNQTFNGDLGLTTSYAGADDFSADRQRYEDALWERTAGDRSSQEANLRATLANKGIKEGTAAWNSEMERLTRQNTDARLATLLAGGQEQQRMVEMARQAAQFGNDALTQQGLFGLGAQQAQNAAAAGEAAFGNQSRAQGMQELFDTRNQPINELNALLTSSQVQAPSYAATPKVEVGGTDLTGMINDNYQARLQASSGGMGGLFGLAGTLGMGAMKYGLLSDRRLKTDVQRVGTTDGGVPIYTYRYVWGGPVHMGVMAQDVPEAAFEAEGGFLAVDYSKVA
ncbi:tail fiber domain-containing protein [Paracoccus sp. SSJ]|uniref:tail fiber domain-containing protein n=1 Tax=Paracoccus sp. SSJ TaxID=3050636 RepID=UPI00254BE3DE|nr:tail fiber domain-containing protein [Paracoccus sp. SSJ]MDK8874409.1 tail fiber domain-containing protein [Paracoccus sp. SSJ]